MSVLLNNAIRAHLAQFDGIENFDLSAHENDDEISMFEDFVAYGFCLFRPSRNLVNKLQKIEFVARQRQQQRQQQRELQYEERITVAEEDKEEERKKQSLSCLTLHDIRDEFDRNPRFFVYGDCNCGQLCKTYEYFTKSVLDISHDNDNDNGDLSIFLSDVIYYTSNNPEHYENQHQSVIDFFALFPDNYVFPTKSIGFASQDANECRAFVGWLPIVDRVSPNVSCVALCVNGNDPHYGEFGILQDLEEDTQTRILEKAIFSDVTTALAAAPRDAISTTKALRKYFNALQTPDTTDSESANDV